jgi:putative transposase
MSLKQDVTHVLVCSHQRRPRRSPRATPTKLVKLILSQRRQHPTWGPLPIRYLLQRHWPHVPWPSASTMGAILKRHGMVADRRRRHRVTGTRPFAACREPNDAWCVDFKGQFPTGDGRLCHPLTVMDAATRYLLACVAFHAPTLENVRAAFAELFEEYGLPKAMRSDNGEPFASASAAAGLSQLSVWWTKLGIRLERIDPGKPQQNGRHERMHLTLKTDTCSPPRHSLGRQQRAFDRFRRIYNEVRPHQALELATPGSLYVPSPRRMPAVMQPLHFPFSDCHRVRADGTIRWRRRRFFISSTLAGGPNRLHRWQSKGRAPRKLDQRRCPLLERRRRDMPRGQRCPKLVLRPRTRSRDRLGVARGLQREKTPQFTRRTYPAEYEKLQLRTPALDYKRRARPEVLSRFLREHGSCGLPLIRRRCCARHLGVCGGAWHRGATG